MIFMTYRPKTAKNVKAEQVTESNVEEILTAFFGSARLERTEDGKIHTLKIATLDGVLEFYENDWIVRTEDGLVRMTDEEFNKQYERARGNKES